jgi:thiamine-monophosphate kinase
MRLRDLGEFGFIERVAQMASCAAPELELGVGDDCAIVRAGDQRLAVTTDAMLEGRHFRRDWLSPEEIGARAMTAGLSDIAAMGARPALAFTSVAIPPAWTVEQATDLARGLVEQAARYGACLAGGDTIAAHEEAFVDVMVLGWCGAHIWRRDAAEVGDSVCVTGRLGGSAAAMAGKLAGLERIPCWEAYARPQPRVAEAQALAPLGLIHAAMDISDGLVQDAGHLCERSGVGIVIRAAEVPVNAGAAQVAAELGEEALPYALSGGEDFELLFTCRAEAVPALQAAVATPITVVGEVVAGAQVVVLDAKGEEMVLERKGWDQFR